MAKAKAEKKPREKKPRQAMIPGTEPELIQEIEDAAESLIEARKAAKQAKSEVDEAALALQALMNRHHKKLYASARYTALLKGTMKVTVRRNPEKDLDPPAGTPSVNGTEE
jgi:hypothetical protein